MYMSMTHFVKLLFQTSIPTQTLNLLVCQVKVRERKLVPIKAFLVSGLFVAPPHVNARGDHFPVHSFLAPFASHLCTHLGLSRVQTYNLALFYIGPFFRAFRESLNVQTLIGHFHDKIQRLSRLFVIALKPWKTVFF